ATFIGLGESVAQLFLVAALGSCGRRSGKGLGHQSHFAVAEALCTLCRAGMAARGPRLSACEHLRARAVGHRQFRVAVALESLRLASRAIAHAGALRKRHPTACRASKPPPRTRFPEPVSET